MKTFVIDCVQICDVWGLFGSTAACNWNEDGSKLNNIIASNTGARSVVFLDEFDKCGRAVSKHLVAHKGKQGVVVKVLTDDYS